MSQDLPPPGGFSPIRYKRLLPNRGPNGAVLLTGVVATMLYGFYMLKVTGDEKWALKHEKVKARLALLPLLSAEEDLKYIEWKARTDREEEELMKDKKGWKMHEKIYHTDRFMKPYVLTGRDSYPY